MTPDDYSNFIAGKHVRPTRHGFTPTSDFGPHLFEWQRDIVYWACERGTAALFLDTGLGKTHQQLVWADQVCRHTQGNVLILCPLAVAQQTKREGDKFQIRVNVARKQADLMPGINVANYEMLDKFDPRKFHGVVLDESSILKNYAGTRKQEILEAFKDTPYKLACTATPAPNDHLELGNHAEFLGVMPSNEMISRWFINDTMRAGGYRLKGHAAADFWRWVATWAVSIQKPSDLNDRYSDEGYILPPLNMHEIVVDVDVTDGAGDRLFRDTSLTATNIHKEMRRTATERAKAVAKIVGDDPDSWLIWCHTNYEADALRHELAGVVEVRGSDKVEKKEQYAEKFQKSEILRLVSKPKIFGAGLNFQHCHKMAFIGLSFSYESMYQAIRRCYRFGQEFPVDVYIVRATTEGTILKTIREKEAAHRQMQSAMVAAMRQADGRDGVTKLNADAGSEPVRTPNWLRARA